MPTPTSYRPLTNATLRAALLALGLMVTVTAVADVYKWTDADGVTHYTDRPPPPTGHLVSVTPTGSPATARAAAPTVAAAPAEPSTAIPTPPPDPETLSRLKRAVATDLATRDEKACQEAETRYRAVIGARHLYRDGPEGERTFLSDAQADAARVDARRDVEELCGHAP